jgi:hypothetical protein
MLLLVPNCVLLDVLPGRYPPDATAGEDIS